MHFMPSKHLCQFLLIKNPDYFQLTIPFDYASDGTWLATSFYLKKVLESASLAGFLSFLSSSQEDFMRQVKAKSKQKLPR